MGEGNAGDLSIVTNNLEIDAGLDGTLTGLFAQVEKDAIGQGGDINLGSEQSAIEQFGFDQWSADISFYFW